MCSQFSGAEGLASLRALELRAKASGVGEGAALWGLPRRRPHLAPILAALSLAACTTPRPALVQAWPAAPIADLKADLPTAAKLPPKATLRDILQAGILDEQAIALLRDEVRVWRKWYSDQLAALK